MATSKASIAYLMVNNVTALQKVVDDIQKIDTPNFTRLVLSFAQPTLLKYETNNLAGTGIFGHYIDPRSPSYEETFKSQLDQGAKDFTKVKELIKVLQDHKIEVFIATGGWDYSCNPELYCKSLILYNQAKPEDCTKEKGYGYKCEPKDQPQNFDWFPNPTKEEKSYDRLVQLSKDLGIDGIDIDYEEFWKGDLNRITWDNEKLIEDIRSVGYGVPESQRPQVYQTKFDGTSYHNLLHDYTKNDGKVLEGYGNDKPSEGTGPFVMPYSVNKFSDIINRLDEARIYHNIPHLKLSTAGPAVGAIPIMTAQYGDSRAGDTIKDAQGGLWWGGNLKGLIYNTALKDVSVLNKLDTISVMSYDLGDKDCGGDLKYKCPLSDQVTYFMNQHHVFLKKDSAGELKHLSGQGPVESVVPTQFNIEGKTAFGFEVGRPAYPADDAGRKKMLLTNDELDKTLKLNADKHDGMIMWEVNKPTWAEAHVDNQASTKDVLQKTCKAFKLDESGYNCKANFPVVTDQDKDKDKDKDIELGGNLNCKITFAMTQEEAKDIGHNQVHLVGTVGNCDFTIEADHNFV